MRGREALTVSSVAVSRVLSLHFVFAPIGWATFYVDDGTGALSIDSDWGSYSYRWGRGSWLGVEPHDLSLALARRFGTHYIADKLFSQPWIYDGELTRREWRKEVAAQRRRRAITAEHAREAFDELESLDFEDQRTLVEAVCLSDALRPIVGEEPWQELKQSLAPRYVVLRDRLLPAFLEELRRVVKVPEPTREVSV